MGFLIDSSILIAAERGQLGDLEEEGLESGLSHVAAITVSELYYGCYRARTPEQERARRRFIEGVLERLVVVSFDREIAEVHAKLAATLDRAGARIGAHDTIIAATALHLRLPVLTHNARDFGRVDGLDVRIV